METLIEARRKCRLCMTKDPSAIRNGSEFAFDPRVVSYWSQWLGNEKPTILIVGQDFSNVDYFVSNSGQDEQGNKTNDNLKDLLGHAGISVGIAPTADRNAPVFLTNSVLCLKTGSMSDPIKDRWVSNCSQAHLRPLIEKLRPRIVVGMGKHGWTAVRRVLGLSAAPAGITLAAGQSWTTLKCTIFAVGHCSGLGLVNRPMGLQIDDWKRLGFFYRTLIEPVKST